VTEHRPAVGYTMCDCGWIPKTPDARKARIAINAHITRERRRAGRHS
jgi:hypothetical protein